MRSAVRASFCFVLASVVSYSCPAWAQNGDPDDPVDPATDALSCVVRGTTVVISWILDGQDPATVLAGLLERDGTVIARIPAGTASYTDTGVQPGTHVYRLILASSAGQTTVRECTVLVGEEPSGVRCEVSGHVVTVAWTVPESVLALGFLVSRDGEVVATLGPDARRYREEAPAGKHTYVVSTNNRLGDPENPGAAGAPDFLIGECQVVVEGNVPGIRCVVQGDVVSIAWRALDATLPFFRIDVFREGQVVAELPPDATGYEEKAPPGEHLYAVVARTMSTSPDSDLLIGRCRVVVGGGLGIQCEVDGQIVTIRWGDVPARVTIRGFRIQRDGRIVATLGPDERTYREEAPPGPHTYSVSALTLVDPAVGDPDAAGDVSQDIFVGSCRVVVEGEPGLAGPADLRCAVLESFPVQVALSWSNPVSYDSIVVVRDNRAIATLEGSSTRFQERDPGAGRHLYEVYGVAGNQRSSAATCVIQTPGPPERDRLFMIPYPASTDDTANGDATTNPAGDDLPSPSDAVTVLLANVQPVQGWSFGVRSDPALLEVAEATTEGTGAGGLNDGSGPTFLAVKKLEDGVTMAAIVDERNPTTVLPPGDGHSLLRIRYSPGPDAERGARYVVSFSSELGSPPVATVVVVGGFEVSPSTSPGVVSFAARKMLRGDSNDDGGVGMADGIHVLDWLFRGGPEPHCLEAADMNGSRQINIADAVYVFQALFVGGSPPPAPYPECGPVPSALGCEGSICEP